MGRKGSGHKPKKSASLNNSKEIKDLVDKLLRISTVPQQFDISKLLENHKEISIITDKLKKVQGNKVLNDDKNTIGGRTSAAIVDRFTSWFEENGAVLKGCDIQEIENYGLGFITNVETPLSSLVISVPRKLMLTVEMAKKTPLKKLIEKDQMLGNMPNVALVIFLLYEKFRPESFWKPYIDILPTTYTTVLYFTVEELQELKGSPTFEPALRQVKNIARQYAYFHKLFHTSDDSVSLLMRDRFTYEEYCWAVSTVMTRQNTIPSEDGEDTINALIPLWDICNHINGTITTDYNPDLKTCECLALKTYQPGEQFFIFYGARTNAEFFINNGFVYEDNEHDGYLIKLGIGKFDPLREKKTELLNKLSISPTSNFFIKKGPIPIDDTLSAFVKIFNMNEEQLRHWLENDRFDDGQYLESAIYSSLEYKSWTFLQDRLKLLLGSYKTTIEEDLKLLEEKQISANQILAIRMRTTEKIILKSGIDYVDQYIKQ